MKQLAALTLGFLVACSSNSGGSSTSSSSPSSSSAMQPAATKLVVIHPSTMTFQQMDSACAGALGSITFSMGHVRAHPAPGAVVIEQPQSNGGIATMTFTNDAKGKSATVSVNARNRSVVAKHVTETRNRTVACIKPD